jgi:membrane-bound serine protease (ClpP class)
MRQRVPHIFALVALVGGVLISRSAVAQATAPVAGPIKGAAVVVGVEGPIDEYTKARLFQRFDRARALGADTVILRVNSYGGLVTSGLDMSRFLKRQNDLHVIALVDDKAISAGAMVALAANEIVMVPGATLGDAAPIALSPTGSLVSMGATERAKHESPILADFRESAQRNGYDVSLAESMVALGRVVYWVQGPTGERRFADQNTLASLTAAGWKPVEGVSNPVDRADSLLTVQSDLAVKLGLAKGEARGVQDLAASRGLNVVADLSPGAGEKFVELLAGGLVRTVLLVVFLLSLYVALHTPGHGMAEAVALISLALLVGIPLLTGYAQWWELVMIMLGLVLLALEVFVIPGFGVAGIAGIALLAGGLVLTFVGNAPGLPGVWKVPAVQQGLRTGLTAVLSGILVSVVLAAWLRRYLPKLPYFSRLILTAPSGRDSTVPAPLHDPNDVWPFAGTIGVATTDLRPGGEAEFPYADDRRVAAVVSDGGYVETGTKIVVREARGNRVVVRAVSATV